MNWRIKTGPNEEEKSTQRNFRYRYGSKKISFQNMRFLEFSTHSATLCEGHKPGDETGANALCIGVSAKEMDCTSRVVFPRIHALSCCLHASLYLPFCALCVLLQQRSARQHWKLNTFAPSNVSCLE